MTKIVMEAQKDGGDAGIARFEIRATPGKTFVLKATIPELARVESLVFPLAKKPQATDFRGAKISEQRGFVFPMIGSEAVLIVRNYAITQNVVTLEEATV